MATNRLSLTVDAVLRIRDLYAERDPVRPHLPRYTHAQIARMMMCSPSTVARALNREGAYTWVGGASMGEQQGPGAEKAAQASLAKLQELLAKDAAAEPEPAEDALGEELRAKAEAIAAKARLGN